MTSEQEVHAALRAWHSKMGYSHMERIRAALVAAEEVRSETDYFTPGDHVEVRANRGTGNRQPHPPGHSRSPGRVRQLTGLPNRPTVRRSEWNQEAQRPGTR